MQNRRLATVLTAAITAATLGGSSLIFAEEVSAEETMGHTDAKVFQETDAIPEQEAAEETETEDTDNKLNGNSWFDFDPETGQKNDNFLDPHAQISIVIADNNENGITAGMGMSIPEQYVQVNGVGDKIKLNDGIPDVNYDPSQLEFRWTYFDWDDGVDSIYKRTEHEIQDWTRGQQWITWKPEKSGKYILQVKVRIAGSYETADVCYRVKWQPHIKGKCQMPYTGEGGGYLIGVESYDNPDNSYSYELLVLDCTKLTAGDPNPWIYTSGQQKVSGNAFWTVWQPQYGYYWTLFRVYDANGNLIDEDCYGFENTQEAAAPVEIKPLDEDREGIVSSYKYCYSTRETAIVEMKTYNYALANGISEVKANTWASDVARAVADRGSVQAVVNEYGYDFLLDDQWISGYEAYFDDFN